MSTYVFKEQFERIYNETYNRTLRFIIIKCNNIEDVNDILQDTYIELLKILSKKKIPNYENIENYILGIANNIIKRHYYKKKKDNIVSYYYDNEEEKEIEVADSFDLEQNIITKENVNKVWLYISNKDLLTVKVFYLYFVLGLKISELSTELNISESNSKNRIYRTLKELKKYLGEESDKGD